jgi:hypothetical protein
MESLLHRAKSTQFVWHETLTKTLENEEDQEPTTSPTKGSNNCQRSCHGERPMKLRHITKQWKHAEIIMIPKPGKNLSDILHSYCCHSLIS